MKELKPIATGWLAVFSRVPLDLYVAGRRIGSTNDDGHIVLAAGHYTVELVSKEFNYQGEVVLDIRPGEVTSHTFTLPTGLLQVETEPGSEIWVEGERAGVAPLGPVPMPIGTRDVVVKHPDRGERRSAVTVRYNEITTLRLNLGEMVRPPQEAFPLPPQARVGPLTP